MSATTVTCGWCGAYVVMAHVQNASILTGSSSVYKYLGAYRSDRSEWRMFQCPGCKSASLAFCVQTPNGGLHVINWYPQRPPKRSYPDSVPPSIINAAQEAHSSLGIGNVQAAVLMARTTIEASAKAKGITGGSLVAKIDALYDQHLIYEHVREAAHEVRLFGNEAAHGDLVDDPLSEEEAGEILELMDMVLDGVFIAPAKTAAVAAARLAKKAAQAAARSGQTTSGA